MAAEKKIKQDIDHLRSDLDNLVRHLEAVSGEKGNEDFGESSDALAGTARVKLQQAVREGERALGRWKESFMGREKQVEETVQAHPITSVLCALGVGFLVGKLIDMARR